jgi:hypothetical protein
MEMRTGRPLGARRPLRGPSKDPMTRAREIWCRRTLSSGDELDLQAGGVIADTGKPTVEPGWMPASSAGEALGAWERGTLTRLLARNPEREDLTLVDAILDAEAGANAAERATALDSELTANKDQL